MQYRVQNMGKTVTAPSGPLTILNNINLEIAAGESVAIIGASGSGKSTLLHLLGALDTPSQGRVLYEDSSLSELDAKARATFRNKNMGFVFQFHHLLSEFTTLENVAMQAIIGGMNKQDAMDKAKKTLELVGLAQRSDHSVTTLSGGERQRAAIARATLLQPEVLLADEPTGNLDGKTGAGVIDLLMKMNSDLGMTLVVVTHNRELASQLGRNLELRSGELL